jgi:hypothetical protein
MKTVTIRETARPNLMTVPGVYLLVGANSVSPPPPTPKGSHLKGPGSAGAFFSRAGLSSPDSQCMVGRRSFGLVSRYIFACNHVREFDPKRVIRTPDHAALSDIIPSNLEHEFVGDGGSAHTRNFCATVREVAQNARAVQMTLRVMDCSRRVPLNTEVSSALALHSDIPIAAPRVHYEHKL